MGRKHRIIAADTIYHIIQRGNNRKFIYEDIEDKREFFELLKDASTRFDFTILYYVLMDNHYHLLVESSETPIWQGVQNLNLRYSKYFNKKYVRTGTIYEGRYSAQVVRGASYFYQVIKYLAMNPVTAGLVKSPEDYYWSAHREIVKGKSRIVNRARLLSFFPGTEGQALKAYTETVEDGILIKPMANLHLNPEMRKDQLFNYVITSLGISEANLRIMVRGDRDAGIAEIRKDFIWACRKAGISINDIADYLSYSPEGIRAIIKRVVAGV